MFGCLRARSLSVASTAWPVASAAWMMRRWLWPPSRVRWKPSSAAASRVNGTPCEISHSIAARPCSTMKRVVVSSHKPPPAISVSLTWFSTLSAESSTAAMPPCA